MFSFFFICMFLQSALNFICFHSSLYFRKIKYCNKNIIIWLFFFCLETATTQYINSLKKKIITTETKSTWNLWHNVAVLFKMVFRFVNEQIAYSISMFGGKNSNFHSHGTRELFCIITRIHLVLCNKSW